MISTQRWNLSLLMKTCYALYPSGLLCLLRSDVLLRSTSALMSFRQFMFAQLQNGEQFPLLHSLEINIHIDWNAEEERKQVQDAMSAILQNATHLQHFVHFRCQDIFHYCSEPGTFQSNTLFTIRTLEQLKLGECGDWHVAELLKLISLLVSALEVYNSDDRGGYHMFPALLHLKSTLIKLLLYNVQIRKVDFQLPCIQELTLLVYDQMVNCMGLIV